MFNVNKHQNEAKEWQQQQRIETKRYKSTEGVEMKRKTETKTQRENGMKDELN